MNIGGGNRISLNQLVEIISELTGKPAKATHTDPRAGDVRHSLADVALARELIGYEPKFDVRAGLEKTVQYFEKTAAP
jgi:UDP-glucose 4-epimerase